MSRLKKIIKTASCVRDLDSFGLSSGSRIALSTRLINNKPWYNVYKQDSFSSFSFYDGQDYEEALRFYKDLLTAFYGVEYTESFDDRAPELKNTIDNMVIEKENNSYNDMIIKRDSLFLGVNDFGF